MAPNVLQILKTMAKIGFYLDGRKSHLNGSVPLKLRLSHNYAKKFYPLEINLLPEDWDPVTCRVRSSIAKAPLLNSKLQKILSDLTVEISIIEADSIGRRLSIEPYDAAIYRYLYGTIHPGYSFAGRFREYCERHKKSTCDLYLCTLRRLGAFDPQLSSRTFEDITVNYLQRFREFLSKTSDSVSYHNIHFRTIRAVINDARAAEITRADPFKHFKMQRVRTRKRSLTVEQLRALFFFRCDPPQQKYVDIFKLSFFLCGTNMIDLYGLEGMEDGRVHFSRSKTGWEYNMRVEPEAMEIIMRHRGKGAMLDLKDKYVDHRNYISRINKNLKLVGPVETGKHGKKAFSPLFPDISTYWARHTWATIAADLDVSEKIISLSLGHVVEKNVTDIYIHRNLKKIDAANRKVIDWVLYGKIDGEVVCPPGSKEFFGDFWIFMQK